MELPEALAPWRQWLEWFKPEQWPLFADWMGRLDALLGPVRNQRQSGVPEPDGLGDLQRRGPYERLLSSEWLLADELPDEFLRRAVGGEHVFLAPQFRASNASRRMLALFDAGPLQFGAARLAQVALLILLARRAREANAEFRWGILQRPPQLHELDGPAQIKRMLDARTYQPVSDAHWQPWRSALNELPQSAGECWLVGQGLPAVEPRLCSHRVLIQRTLDGKALSVDVLAGGRKRVTLPIPEDRQAVPLLKGHFAGERAAPVAAPEGVPRITLNRPPVIASSGTNIALQLLDEPGMVVISLPDVDQKKALTVHRNLWKSGQEALAAGFVGRTLGAILSDASTLQFWKLNGLGPVNRPHRDELNLPPGTATFLPMAMLRNRTQGRLLLLDAQGHLAFWAIDTGSHPAEPRVGVTHRLADGVLGLAKVNNDEVAYVRKVGDRAYAHTVNANGVVSAARFIGTPGSGGRQVLFAGTPNWDAMGGCAWLKDEQGRQSWELVVGAGRSLPKQQLVLESGWKAIGLLLDDVQTGLALLMLSANQRSVVMHAQGQQQPLFSTAEAIVKVSFCPMSGLVAALTSARELLVYSVPTRSMRLQVFCTELGEKQADPVDA